MDPEHPSTPRPVEVTPPDLSVLAEVEGELAAVERALQRLDEGSYGTCEVCGQSIGDDRLEADPASARCAGHASA